MPSSVGSTIAKFPVSLNEAVSEQVSVAWSTADGTAVAGIDYTADSGVLTFEPGEVLKTIDVFVNGRATTTEDRVFYVNMEPPTNAILAEDIGACVISVDATGETPVLSAVIAKGEKGNRGYSAYEVWLNLGNEGTEEDFLDSLKPDPEELAEEVAPFINGNALTVTSSGTALRPSPDTLNLADLAARIAYLPPARTAIAPAAFTGINVIPAGDFDGFALDPKNFTGLSIALIRAGKVVECSWQYLLESNEVRIEDAQLGDLPVAVQFNGGSKDATRAPVTLGGETKRLGDWIELINSFIESLQVDDSDTDGSARVGHNGGTVKAALDYLNQRVADLPSEVDAAGTAAAAVAAHDADPAAHAPLSAFISAEADRAEAARNAALQSRGVWPTTAAGIGQGVAGTSALAAGSGGTNGTFDLAFSGGTQVLAPKGRFVVEGGAVTQVIIDYPGYYSAGTPAISFAASSGLAGASATAVMGPNTPVGDYFSTPGVGPDDANTRYLVTPGPVAVIDDSQPNSAKVQAVSIESASSSAVIKTLLPGSGRAGDQFSATDPGFNVGHRVDKHGVFVSGGMPYFNVRDTNPDTTWGVADRLGLSPISTGRAEDGFPIRNPWLSRELNERLGAAPLIAFDGDSRIDQGVDTYRTNTMGIPYWLSFLSGGRFDVRDELNFGIGGQTSPQILARVNSTIATCKAFGCTKLVALFSLNDRGSISGSAGSTAALTIANLEAYQSAILSAGIDLIWVAELPCGNPDWQAANPTEPDYGLQASAAVNHLAVRRWQLEQPFKHPRVSVADPFPQMVDTTTFAINGRAGVMKDAKHESAVGAYLMAKALLPIIEQRLPPLSRVTSHAADVYSSVNPGGTLLGNKTMFWGAGGTFIGGGSHTGTLPDGWEANIAGGLTAAFTSVPAADGGAFWLQVAISGTSAAPQWLTLSTSATTVAPMVTGAEFMGVCEMEVDAGHSGLIANMLRPVLTMSDTSTPHCAAGVQAFLSTDINKHLPDVALSGVAVTPPRPVPAGTASSAVLQLQLVGDTGTAVSAVVRYRLPSLNMKIEV